MDRDTLLKFAKRILDNGSEKKAELALHQLQMLLQEQGGNREDIFLLSKMIDSTHELKAMSDKPYLTTDDVKIAERRAYERRVREEAAMHRGRC